MKHIPAVLVVLLLLLMAMLAGGAALRESITIDEVAHLGAGVSSLQKLDLRFNEEHPPLAKALAALPLVLRGVHSDYSDFSWTFSQNFLGAFLGEWVWGHSLVLRWNDPYSTLAWGRFPMLLLTVALGFCVYAFASQLGDSWGGLLCLAAFVSTPTFLAFGPLILTDMALTLFSLLTLWSFASLWRSPNRRNLRYFSLSFSAALLSKFSAGLLLVGFLFFRLSLRLFPVAQMPQDRVQLRAWRRVRGHYLWKGIFLAALMVYAVMLFLSWNQPTDSLAFLGGHPAALFLRRLLMPAWIYLRGLFLFVVMSRRPSFILGHSYPRGIWFYFPVLFLLKSTLACLLMLLLAVPVALFGRGVLKGSPLVRPDMALHWRAVWVFLVVFATACILSPLTISIRHFTVPITLLILLMAPVPRTLARLRQEAWPAAQSLMALLTFLALVSLVTVIRAFPYYIPFINSLSFGRPAYALINDSNLDWNQALPDVARFVSARGLSHVLLDEYGFIEPSVYVPQAEFWNCQRPRPADARQLAIVSASMIEDGHACLWLLNYPHISFAGGSMYAFELPGLIPSVGDPGGPPPPEAYRNFGQTPGPDLRLMFLNCIRDETQLQPTLDKMSAEYQADRAKREAQGGKR